MSPVLSRRRYRIARRTVGSWVLRGLGPVTLRRLARSWRVEELGEAPGDGGALICLWHGRMVCGLDHFGRRGWSVLVSPSDDGDLSERLLEEAGYRVVRGSASRGGARALREMLELLGGGAKVILTPDGPRGPRHAMNPGVAWMARATGFPVHPLGMACDRAWRLSSWDRFTIPKPRARVAFTWGTPLRIDRDAAEDELAAGTQALREGLFDAERAGFDHLRAEQDSVIRVGPAGWSYDDWAGVVYPRRKPRGFHALPYLARFVQCLEVNSTFYSPPRAELCERWVRLVADRPDFVLTAKLHRDFTHRARADSWNELEADAQRFLAGIRPLARAGKLAALLVQFPFSFRHGSEEVRHLGMLKSLFGEHPLVLEVRHASWFRRRAWNQLSGLGYSLAHIDLPAARDHPPRWHEPTGPIGYLRLHGRNQATWFARGVGRDARYDYLYSSEELEDITARARRIAGGHDVTFVITNNHFEGKAVANALEIMADLRGSLVDAPADLVRHYPHLRSSVRAVGDPPRGGQRELF